MSSETLQRVGEVRDEQKERDVLQWHSHWNFMMALVCWTVGLGNCWRFPVTASVDGGGAFLIPYLVETVIIAIPYTYMELGLGQFSNKGSVGVWALCPLWKGVGVGSVVLLIVLMVYYSVICSYLLFFFFGSLSTVIPWSTCDPKWAEVNCFTFEENASIRLSCNQKYGEVYCDGLKWQNSALQYWHNRVLGLNIHDGKLGHIQWNLLYCNLTTATIIFLLSCKGTRSLEKMVTFLSIFPYLELVVLLFVSLIDPGSSRGIKTFLTPDFVKLGTAAPWGFAFQQIMFSIGLGLGGLTTIGSHCRFRNPVHIEAIAINLLDIISSLSYGVMVYNYQGALSYDLNIPMKEIVEWKDTLLFAKIPLALLYLPGVPQVWGALFYSSIYIIGVRSLALMMATVLSTIYDRFPKMLRYTVFTSAVCSLLLFLMGIPFVTQIGAELLNYIDNMTVGPALVLVCFLETVGVICIYGMTQFADDMHFMLGFRGGLYWQACWSLLPFIVGAMFVISMHHFIAAVDERPRWLWIAVVQWVIMGVPLVLLGVGVAARIMNHRHKTPCRKLFQPSIRWGPTDPILRKSRQMFTAHAMTKEYMYRQNWLRNKILMQDIDDDSDAEVLDEDED